MAEVDPGAGSAGGEGDRDGYSGEQKIRWLLALAVALGGAVYYLIGVHTQVLCHWALGKGGTKPMELCGPPSISELVPFALIIAILLLPDLGELGIAGLVSLKRKVQIQEARQGGIERQLARLDQKVSQQTTVNQHSPTHLAIHLAGEQFDLKTAAARLPSVEPEADDGDSGTTGLRPTEPENGSGGNEEPEPVAPADEQRNVDVDTPRTTPETPETEKEDWRTQEKERALETQQLLFLAKNIGQYATISRMRQINPDEKMAGLTDDQQATVDRWNGLFSDEIRLVLDVRNTVAHTPYAIDVAELREANRIGRKLLRILLQGLGASTEPIDHFEQASRPTY